MKKTLIAIAALAAFSVSYAQSSVTLFGVIDTGITYGSASPGSNLWQLSSGEWSGSRLGFRGREDLGGGLEARFHGSKPGFDSDSGVGKSTSENNVTKAGGDGIGFNRRSTDEPDGRPGANSAWAGTRTRCTTASTTSTRSAATRSAAAYMWQAGREMYNNTTAVKRVSNSIGYHFCRRTWAACMGGSWWRSARQSEPSNLNAGVQYLVQG
jgi:hypothetical protein